MATIEAQSPPFSDQFRDYRRVAARWISGPGLWVIIGTFLVWALVAERDGVVTGVVIGAVFALGAVGLTLIFAILKFGHFAHGDTMMLSAYFAFMFLTGTIAGERQNDLVSILPVSTSDLPGATTDIWRLSFGYGLLLAMLLSVVATALLLVLLNKVVYAPLIRRKSGIVTLSIASLGLALVIRSAMLIFWGSDPRFYSPGIRQALELPLDIRILYDQVFILAVSIAMAGFLYVFLYRTRLGKAMRATSDNADLARVSGIDTERIVTWMWVVAGLLVAVAGVMLALQAQLKPELGFIVLLPLFAAAVLGGVGSPQGALIGGLLIGIIQEVAVTSGLVEPGYKFSVALVVLILVLLVRPRGLFGERG
jgi:branched-chain amino acid transport system permease protein/neutral amino acid transport system permease protein